MAGWPPEVVGVRVSFIAPPGPALLMALPGL